VKPTVFGRVDPTSAIAQEEIFGPVLSIITYRDEDEAVRIANDTPTAAARYGRAATSGALRVARRLRTGQVDINGGSWNSAAPFGGYKQSGRPRERRVRARGVPGIQVDAAQAGESVLTRFTPHSPPRHARAVFLTAIKMHTGGSSIIAVPMFRRGSR
jgi:hypothetical protein